jgi:5-methyltetrahydropteroyltriglutamate--homocysteine methyltransferase
MSIADRGLLIFASISLEERRRIGVHTCPGSDLDSTHSAYVDYVELLPSLFEQKAAISTSRWRVSGTSATP